MHPRFYLLHRNWIFAIHINPVKPLWLPQTKVPSYAQKKALSFNTYLQLYTVIIKLPHANIFVINVI